MKTVKPTALAGNFGAAHVSAVLSSQCYVRPVATDTDIGIDLYCESVQDDHPYLHFWMQVKTGNQCKISADRRSAYFDFKARDLCYWRRQPVPIFAALVPTTWPPRAPATVYVVNITKYLVDHGDLNANQKTFRIHSDHHWPAGDHSELSNFLDEVVPHTSALMMCMHGVAAPLPTLGAEYIRIYPDLPITLYAQDVLHQVRCTAANSILSMWKENCLGGPNRVLKNSPFSSILIGTQPVAKTEASKEVSKCAVVTRDR